MDPRAGRRAAPPVLALLLAACGGGGGGGSSAPPKGPLLLSISPGDGVVGVDPLAVVTLRFREPMDPASLAAGGLVLAPAYSPGSVPAILTMAEGDRVAVLDPQGPLQQSGRYQVRLDFPARTADGRPAPPVTVEWVVYGPFGGGGGGGGGSGGTVAAARSMAVGRSGHAAALLPDGRVAVFGGFATDAAVTDSIETYDPGVDRWTTSAATLTVARARCTATVLPDGRVLVAGGETGSATTVGSDRFEIFDPLADAVVAQGSLAERRTNHRAVPLPDGRVLICGGSRTDSDGAPNFSRATAEIFDPVAGSSAPVASMGVARAGHSATALPDGRVLVAGGHGTALSTEAFDPGTGLWGFAGNMASARRDHGAAPLDDGVLVLGGGTRNGERWEAAGNRWIPLANMGDERTLPMTGLLPDGRVLVVGGERPALGGGTFFHNGMEVYQPATQTFVYWPLAMTAGRSASTMTLLPSGAFLVVGGKSSVAGGAALRTCERITVVDP